MQRLVIRSGMAALLWALLGNLGAFALAEPRATFQDAPAEVSKDDLYDWLLEADEALLDGEYHAAIEWFDRILEARPEDVESLAGKIECCRILGKLEAWEAAVTKWAEVAPKDIDAQIAHGEYLFERGRLEEAEAAYRRALDLEPTHFGARIRLGKLFRYLGRDQDAETAFRAVANHAATEEVIEDAERLTWLGHAYWELDGFEEAAEVFQEAIRDDRLLVEPRRALGDLYLSKYQTADALTEYRLALENAPDHPDLILGIAEAYFARERNFTAQRELRRALEINPNHSAAIARIARVELEDRRYDEGREWIDKVLSINPRHKLGLALLATHHYVMNRTEDYEATSKQVLGLDANYAILPLTVAQVLGGLYRFADGLPFAKRAIEMDPKLWPAYDLAGRFSFNTGDHEAGTAYLKKAQQRDNFRFPWRLNMLSVASIYDEFVERTNEHFKLYIHVDENEVFRGYVTNLLEECYADLTRRYEFTPKNPTIVEVFPDQDDFAVRNVGTTGIDLILGICFGRVITLNSPGAKPPGFFSWAQTAWHEYAHVLTLQMTRSRIPRWLTEGISVYEERRKNPIWERRQEQELFNAYHNDKIFPLREINTAFRTPRIGFAYYQGSLLVEFIEKKWGFDAVLEILKLYGEDLTTEEIMLEVLQLTLESFDEQFLGFVGDKVSSYRLLPQWDGDRLEEFRDAADLDPDNADLHAKLAWAYYYQGGGVDCEAALGRALEADPDHPVANLLRGALNYDEDRFDRAERYLKRGLEGGAEDAFARLRLAQIYERSGKLDDAVREYKRAKSDFPFYVGGGNPYERLETLYRARKDEEAAIRELRAYADLVNTDLEARQKLFAWYSEKGDLERARRYLEEMLWVDPFDLKTHVELAEIYRQTDRRADEVGELEVAVALADGPGKAELLVRLARAEIALERLDDARFHLEDALRLDASNADARALLDEITSP